MADRPAKRTPRPGSGPRLAVIEGFQGRRSAIPFALLVLSVLAIGLVGLLMLNTAMDNNSVRMAKAQQQQANLTDREQQLSQQLAGLSEPSTLASEAAGLGLVPNPQPAFLNPTTGTVLGSPSPAPTPSPIPTPSPTGTPSPSVTPSASSSGTPTGTATVTGTATATATASGNANAVGNAVAGGGKAAATGTATATSTPSGAAKTGTTASPSTTGSPR